MINYKNILFLLFLILIFVEGCDNNPVASNASLNSDFNIKFGQSVYIPGENLHLIFEDVVEESRCPQGVNCFVEGTAKIKLLISQGTDVRIDTVQTYLPQKIISIGEINNSYLFWVKNVTPYPKQNQKIIKQDYVLTLNVSHFTYGFPNSEIENKTGLFGQVFIGPTLPVERRGYISYKPYATSFLIVNIKADSIITDTDSTGRFIALLPAGEYRIFSNKGSPIFNDTSKYTVNEGKMTFINIKYINPIR